MTQYVPSLNLEALGAFITLGADGVPNDAFIPVDEFTPIVINPMDVLTSVHTALAEWNSTCEVMDYEDMEMDNTTDNQVEEIKRDTTSDEDMNVDKRARVTEDGEHNRV